MGTRQQDINIAGAAVKTDWIFINAAVHRTGSTFLQRLVNASSHTHIWGETNIGPKLLQIATLLEKAEKRGGGSQREAFKAGDRNIWMAHMVPEALQVADGLRLMMERIFAVPDRIAGSKEIRYRGRVIRYLAELFPDARFLLLTRNPLDALLSYRNTGWPDRDEASFLETWSDRSGEYWKISRELPGRALFIRYEDLDEAKASEIFRFLDLPLEENVVAVIKSRIGKSKGTETLTAADRESVRAVCGETYRTIYGNAL